MTSFHNYGNWRRCSKHCFSHKLVGLCSWPLISDVLPFNRVVGELHTRGGFVSQVPLAPLVCFCKENTLSNSFFLFSLGCFTHHCNAEGLQSTKTSSTLLCFLTLITMPRPCEKILCTELIVSVTFNYKVCNIWGTTMAHDPVIISDESMKVWHEITTVKQNLAPEEGKWNNADWNCCCNLWQALAIIHHLNLYVCPLSLTPVWQGTNPSLQNPKK